ncbi:MAG: Ribosomal RNA small subunit methyltransferase I [Candidatus Kaiserbacteria bacterium GW2011_GWC2_49_12]|uniref:Ribosomal RNA small subunit methyltransferase I n=4 Tax=Candidatus Kaiseribacteriota TaxID=1752734 RepID=A0A0G1WG60_9BACT|nr:MAG: Ribosomal RNA small subunit methyltransferase I [Candidatus Kaiserbacteria bacterium GW2011_GWC2_49_12]KKW17788.1 MAG: Ribosomal RNA small subunit methyltransferase I [Candidatus Kaiserbacteria bacterium GW2011_GWB1_50_17]KKW18362.1 MAG: Ribosomal RNA small subunit methyltransferase I [Candidatus Kaiserbacteria bacterium GW2011_GWA1_50_28]OGG87978.1 MAG: 16S rRNA (cytidine(1402)-2'-O)-methyltransferase [Candidatus Kaiserbacteria bacterium RIFCSPLOWO2_12_FULL_50_28]HCM43851.1 16S rRNA (c
MGKLSIVATPIGNLGDMTFRGLWTLKECNAIYAEDTRVVSKLLSHYGLRTSVFRLDAATEGKKAEEVIERMENGEHVAYVTDAGTPGISDPGARLVAKVREELPEANIEAIPGPSALTAALSIAGISAGGFLFLGFLPHKKGRQTAVKKIAESEVPVILYESPHRILKFLGELANAAPNARVTIARELTKIHEEVLIGSPAELSKSIEKNKKARGEFVVIIQV